MNPTPYKISTITATGSINTGISLDSLFEHIPLVDSLDAGKNDEDGIIFAEYGKKKSQTIHKGVKQTTSKRNTNAKKRFDNQVTIVYRFADPERRAMVNAKIFKNGNIQMTGIRYVEQGSMVIEAVIGVLKNIYNIDENVVENMDGLRNTAYKIRLINCDFRVGFEIKRENLYKLVLNEYSVPCSYEPCIYPGVKIQYWWNREQGKGSMGNGHDGCCYCTEKCDGKGSGVGESECKKITIAVFQSGCIIITGGQSIEQIDEAYAFICACIGEHYDRVKKVAVALPEPEVKKKKVYLKKSSIRPAPKAKRLVM
jgi:TATA-box binding protein (TBP) (component of TFIID and TFIIIB)